jgi:DNA-binding CsgD family transcriptional regulator
MPARPAELNEEDIRFLGLLGGGWPAYEAGRRVGWAYSQTTYRSGKLKRLSGTTSLDALVVWAFDSHTVPARRDVPPAFKLEDQELEVLEWVGRGLTRPAIGKVLKVSKETVTYRIQTAMARNHSRNVQHLLAQACSANVLTRWWA